MSLAATVDHVRSEAATRSGRIDGRRIAATLLLFPFIAVGFILGRVMVGIAWCGVFIAAAWRSGYRKGRRRDVVTGV